MHGHAVCAAICWHGLCIDHLRERSDQATDSRAIWRMAGKCLDSIPWLRHLLPQLAVQSWGVGHCSVQDGDIAVYRNKDTLAAHTPPTRRGGGSCSTKTYYSRSAVISAPTSGNGAEPDSRFYDCGLGDDTVAPNYSDTQRIPGELGRAVTRTDCWGHNSSHWSFH